MANKDRNPRDSESRLFQRLTRIFSGPIVNYRRQTERNLRRKQLKKYKFRDPRGVSFKRLDHNDFDSIRSYTTSEHSRSQRYAEFDQMDQNEDCSSVLDVYGDEITTSSPLSPLLRIECTNQEIRDVLDVLYKNILNLDQNLFAWARTLCKYGDFFLYLDLDEKDGIKGAIGLPPAEVERLEGEDPNNPNYIQFIWGSGNMTFENWQMAHFRILGNDKYQPFGTSIMAGARRVFRLLVLMENAMILHRVTRSPDRRIFYVDVGNIAPEDVEQIMEKFATEMKRNQIVNENTGKIDLRMDPMSINQDFFIPVRGNVSNTKIETLKGQEYSGVIDDVKYLRNKLFTALKVPMDYISRNEGSEGGEQNLAVKDTRFARTIQRIQKALISEIEKIGMIHLYIMGFKGKDLLSFRLHLNNPSKIAELQELEHWRTKFDVATSATENFFSRRWIAEKIFAVSPDEMTRIQREMFGDALFDANIDRIRESMQDVEGAMGEFGGDLAGGEGESKEGDEDDVLLAQPGKRDDDAYLTPGSKGKLYKPVDFDKRPMGARKRNMHSLGQTSKARGGMRNKVPGYNDMLSLGRGVVNEENMERVIKATQVIEEQNENSNYSKDEEKQINEIEEYLKKFEAEGDSLDFKKIDKEQGSKIKKKVLSGEKKVGKNK